MVGRQTRGPSIVAVTAAWLAFACILQGAAPAAPEVAALKKIHVNGVELHYLEQGTGDPVVFVHGGLVDYRRWANQVQPFAGHYRVITYSRRYNFPNRNPAIDPAYSAAVDAEDLAALIQALHLGRVHIVGESYGAYAALFLAVRHPGLVRSLVLAEAPMMRWLNASPDGRIAFDEFQEHLWRPVGRAFKAGQSQEALKVVVGYFLGGASVDSIPVDLRALIEVNLPEWQALSTSVDAFPSLSRQEVAGIRAPTLLLGGELTLPLQKILDAQYQALLPNCQRVIIAHATHEMWDEQPGPCREQTLKFIARVRPGTPAGQSP